MSRDDLALDESSAPARITRAMLLAAGLLLMLAAFVYNEWSVGLVSSGEFRELTLGRIRGTQVLFAIAGAMLLVASEGVRRVAALRALAAKPATPLALLVVLGLLGPLLLLDLSLRPFIEPKTSLFEPDRDLGWRPRPGASGEWGQVQIEINAKGLRGPEVPWERRPDTSRILYLGDSVTFGFGVERVEDTYPYRIAEGLQRRLGRPVETVNSGVGGWSPWQQHAYLVREGFRYQPDLIVVGFVLNDVTEKLSLTRFGGSGSGWQLANTARSWLDAWLSRSAIVSFARDGIAQFRFGADVFLGAQRYEAAEVKWLAANARSERLRGAWQLTFENLGKIFRVASERGIPVSLVVFPYSFQLENPVATSAPQQMLREFDESQGVPHLDLLPAFTAAAQSAAGDDGVADIRGLYLDPCHLSPRGHRVAATAIAEFLVSQLDRRSSK